MKNLLYLSILMLFGAGPVAAQTADSLVNEGRSFLSSQNITNANNKFAAAVAVSPQHQTANFFRGISRVLALPNQAEGEALLTRVGMSQTNRNLFNWTDWFSEDAEGVVITPEGVNAAEITTYLRTI